VCFILIINWPICKLSTRLRAAQAKLALGLEFKQKASSSSAFSSLRRAATKQLERRPATSRVRVAVVRGQQMNRKGRPKVVELRPGRTWSAAIHVVGAPNMRRASERVCRPLQSACVRLCLRPTQKCIAARAPQTSTANPKGRLCKASQNNNK